MTDSAEHSVTPRYGQAIVQAAERLGLTLPVHLTERIRHAERVPLSWQDELWEAFCTASGDPLAGLRLGLEIQVGHLDSVGMLLVTCDTLGEALEELIEYAPVIGDGGEFQLHRHSGQVYIDYQPHLSIRQPERVEAVMASMLKLTRWATGERFQPSGIWFAHAPLAPLDHYEQLLGCPVHFNAPCNHLGFAAAQLELPQIQANSALRDHLRRLADQTLTELGQHSLSARVQQLVRTYPRWGKERIAEQLELSGRHLNRKLAEEGLSFKSLRESVQQQIACDALQADKRVAEIAEQLGFSDENAFVRAFRRWQGVTPARFKAQGGGRD
ncbi:AraC family transcriptional regulator [Halopseudomonas pelagia]|uniref:AraC family transcriptional regulator n=1 Tax=Halopseudomonas pelagia TaxID=553151 RepID=A0AA91U500_9GAMM|nr:AraC family transcriptional regulator [Halopseudomonas pelagia]PCD00484.1 AraC family transcriptional regulator [Halopseudomonas pelagia]QFY55187.1 AraC family transcriptional regulator [Halopseudomonas pelagia]